MKIIEKALLSLMISMFWNGFTLAQDRCGTDAIMEQIIDENPALLQEFENSFRNFYASGKVRSDEMDCPIIIPVHVIILHHPDDTIGQKTNLSDERIHSQLEVLNQDFSRTNPDRDLTPPEFPVGDTGIRFYLASTDPDGQPTTGITRYATTEPYDIGEDAEVRNVRTSIKSETGWDRDIYLNIWVAPTLSILGFAKVPTSTFLPNWNDDGCNVLTEAFGGPGYATRENFDLGRTLTHEVGHYLGLGHIWRSNGCTLDDGISDTPKQNHATTGCPSHPSPSCGNDGDMFMNYMDYTDDACMNAFTIEQGAYMRHILNTSRSSLLTAAGYACRDKILIEMQVSTFTHPTCPGAADGMIEVQACGGANDHYRYSINGSPYSTNSIFQNLPAGYYEIRVKNLFGVSGTIEFELEDPAMISLDTIAFLPVNCIDSQSGLIHVAAHSDDEELSFTYRLNDGPWVNEARFPDLPVGDYQLDVQRSDGCIETYSIILEGPEALGFSVDELVLPSCPGSQNATILLAGRGGENNSYTFSLDGINFIDEGVFSGLGSGTYEITVKTENGCQNTSSLVIPDPPEIQIIATPTDVICHGENNGSLEIATTGGQGNHRIIIEGKTYESPVTLHDLYAGEYEVEVVDTRGCITSTTISILQPDPLVIQEIDVKNITCAGDFTGVIEFSVSGGRPFYEYRLDNRTSAEPVFRNLKEGLYTITANDSNGCKAEIEAAVKTNSPLEIAVLDYVIPTCATSNNGSISLMGRGGSGTYQYSIDGSSFQSSSFINDLSKGKHIVYINDGNDCVAALPIDLPGPEALQLNIVEVNEPTCESLNNGSITWNGSGGSGNLTFKLNGNSMSDTFSDQLGIGTYVLEVIDANFCRADTGIILTSPQGIEISLESITETNCPLNKLGSVKIKASGGFDELRYMLDGKIQAHGEFTALAGGPHTIEVTDTRGCIDSFDFEVPVIGGLDVSVDKIVKPLCFNSKDGEIIVSATGGQMDYAFQLAELLSTDGTFNGLSSGVYAVTAKDNFGCVGTTSFQIDAPSQIRIDTVYLKEPTCFEKSNGIVDVDARGGTSPLRYLYGSQNNFHGVFTGLNGGVIPVTVIDAHGCEFKSNIDLPQPAKIEVTDIDLKSPTCHGEWDGSIAFTTIGGTGNKTIKFQGNTYLNSLSLEGKPAGQYNVEIKDANNCLELLDIFLEEPDVLRAIDTIIIPQTALSLGGIEMKYAGGTKPYLFSLDNNDFTPSAVFDQLKAGDYTIEVLDTKDCLDRVDVTVPYDDGVENPDGTVSGVWVSQPRTDQNFLHFTLHGNQSAEYNIYSIDGKLLLREEIQLSEGYHTKELPIGQWPSGTYILNFRATRDYENVKFVKR